MKIDHLDEGEIILLEFLNRSDTKINLFVEPWCYQLELPSNISLRLTAISPEQDKTMITVEFHPNLIVVWGVPRAIMRLYADGQKIWECFEPFLLPEDIDPNFGKPSGPSIG